MDRGAWRTSVHSVAKSQSVFVPTIKYPVEHTPCLFL